VYISAVRLKFLSSSDKRGYVNLSSLETFMIMMTCFKIYYQKWESKFQASNYFEPSKKSYQLDFSAVCKKFNLKFKLISISFLI
jgi:hypothetical protein